MKSPQFDCSLGDALNSISNMAASLNTTINGYGYSFPSQTSVPSQHLQAQYPSYDTKTSSWYNPCSMYGMNYYPQAAVNDGPIYGSDDVIGPGMSRVPSPSLPNNLQYVHESYQGYNPTRTASDWSGENIVGSSYIGLPIKQQTVSPNGSAAESAHSTGSSSIGSKQSVYKQNSMTPCCLEDETVQLSSVAISGKTFSVS